VRQSDKRGIFVTFEGADGTGKTTQFRLLQERLQREGIPHISVREPGATEAGERLRRLLLHSPDTRLAPETEALLYAAARVQLVREKILPTLERGVHVLCDRYVDSSLAYQGYGLGLPLSFVRDVNQVALHEAMPDLTVLFSLPPGIRYGEPDNNDRIELRNSEFHQRVQQGYLELAAEDPGRIVVVDASEAADLVESRVWKMVKGQLCL